MENTSLISLSLETSPFSYRNGEGDWRFSLSRRGSSTYRRFSSTRVETWLFLLPFLILLFLINLRRHGSQSVSFPISFGSMAPNDDEPVKLFLSIGLDEKTATTTINNPKVTANLTAVINEVSFLVSPPPSSHVSSLSSSFFSPRYSQLDAAVSFFYNHASEDFKLNEFEEACGVGVEVSTEDIEKAADEVFEENKKTIVEQRYRTNDPKIVKDVIDGKMYELLGKKTAADNEQSSLDDQETE
ncbi:hypothetical protein YC2023_084902 [Brassica napus]